MKTVRMFIFCMVFLVLTCYVSTAKADLVNNGSFESYGKNINDYTMPGMYDIDILPGDTYVSGWTIFGGNIDYITGLWQASSGIASLDLAGSSYNAAGGIMQTIDTTLGNHYVLSFDMSGNPGVASYKTMQVMIGEHTYDFNYDTAANGNTTTDMKWQNNQIYFTADSDTTELRFANNMDPDNLYGPAIDNVSVAVAPEPISSILFLIGAATLGISRFRKKRTF